ncbi:MAG: hypothetical protein M1501_03975 [Candidatus Omnitrophica bacterium]|nr:hypothetical protein [Candidatus Omnitrophota bacterium]
MLRHPGETLEIGESGYPGWGGGAGSCDWQGWSDDSHWVYRHNGGADLLFCDGHVKWYSQSILNKTEYYVGNGTPTKTPGYVGYSANDQYDWPFTINPAVSY